MATSWPNVVRNSLLLKTFEISISIAWSIVQCVRNSFSSTPSFLLHFYSFLFPLGSSEWECGATKMINQLCNVTTAQFNIFSLSKIIWNNDKLFFISLLLHCNLTFVSLNTCCTVVLCQLVSLFVAYFVPVWLSVCFISLCDWTFGQLLWCIDW